ncbi:hypothetical protein COU78_06525 [Candidatus Peregrinibacteria bacterium CG10_big_fil_rev_8_21_14_0_10_49_24]|nr:MAG: hypothetical protein COU78_06525 [Candidatus Peregrinibacteria bacterium CG10_big_fil_rev_8_21_14_0_10_49_24]PJA67689.1 MAG: hypothetical protein CO157_03185 [Candidatus Peregrinibacteria bacterium CG_4_9_14_3_um_filter_49_12]
MSFIKHHHRTYALQTLGFLGLIAFTGMTVAISDSTYKYASVLHEDSPVSNAEEQHAATNTEPCGNVDLLAVVLQHFR